MMAFTSTQRLAMLLIAGAWLVCTGCTRQHLETGHGRRAGYDYGGSVNGTAVLADMFAKAGHVVETRTSLSPHLHEVDTIVWFPDDVKVPSQHVTYWLEQWLAGGYGRTLIVVGRDYDAAPFYWKSIAGSKEALANPKYAEERRSAEQAADHEHGEILDGAECTWFITNVGGKEHKVTTLSGPWSQGIDPAKTDISVWGRLETPDWAETLLASGDERIVTRQQLDQWPDSQLIVINNGSFLLNLPLVNHEHRKLAGKLIASVKPNSTVVFLESGYGGVRINDKDPAPKMPNGLEVLAIWPMNAILLHLAVLGIIFCFARWPIFGTPLAPTSVALSDFGQHIDALGDLLSKTRDRAYAEHKLQSYRDSGGSGSKT